MCIVIHNLNVLFLRKNIWNNRYTTRVSKVYNKLSRVFVEENPEISSLAFYAEISEFGGKENKKKLEYMTSPTFDKTVLSIIHIYRCTAVTPRNVLIPRYYY